MAKIKENQRLKKIGYVQTPELNHIVFSFEFWTTNAKYNFEYFKKSLRDKEKAYDELHSKLHELSGMSILEVKERSKERGAEYLPYSRFSPSFLSILNNTGIVTPDSKLKVIRICNQNYRLICKEGVQDSKVLYLLGIDFDYSAYDHGS